MVVFFLDATFIGECCVDRHPRRPVSMVIKCSLCCNIGYLLLCLRLGYHSVFKFASFNSSIYHSELTVVMCTTDTLDSMLYILVVSEQHYFSYCSTIYLLLYILTIRPHNIGKKEQKECVYVIQVKC